MKGNVLYRMEMTLGGKIKAARETLGLDQSELAELVGVEPATISRWENDVLRPRVKKLKTIADHLGKPVEWFQEPTLSAGEFESRLAALEERAFKSQGQDLLTLIPNEVIQSWSGAGVIRQSICLFLLTRESQYLDVLGTEIGSHLEAVLQLASLSRQPKQKAP
jgi:transcriptional regulator with XRE-family HTH domain